MPHQLGGEGRHAGVHALQQEGCKGWHALNECSRRAVQLPHTLALGGEGAPHRQGSWVGGKRHGSKPQLLSACRKAIERQAHSTLPATTRLQHAALGWRQDRQARGGVRRLAWVGGGGAVALGTATQGGRWGSQPWSKSSGAALRAKRSRSHTPWVSNTASGTAPGPACARARAPPPPPTHGMVWHL